MSQIVYRRANVIKTGGKRNPETGERMYDSDNDDSNAYDNDDADDDALFSSNVFQPQVTLKEEYVEMDSAKYPWNFLETSGYFTLIGSTLLDVNDRQSTLVFINCSILINKNLPYFTLKSYHFK